MKVRHKLKRREYFPNNNNIPSVTSQVGSWEGSVYADLTPLPWEVERLVSIDPQLKLKHYKANFLNELKISLKLDILGIISPDFFFYLHKSIHYEIF